MFATLLGGLPWPDALVRDRTDLDAAIAAVVSAQDEAGLEPLTDGRLADEQFEAFAHELSKDPTVACARATHRWRAAAALTNRAVKQALPGPYTLARRARGDRVRTAIRLAEGLRRVVDGLAEAGCPLVEIEETEAHIIGNDGTEQRAFREAHQVLVTGITSTHLSLSVVGGSADEAGAECILAAPYASLAVDLIGGPDNWRLASAMPGDRGVIVGALGGSDDADEPKEILLYAAHQAASMGGRGRTRVGIGSAGGYGHLPWAVATRKMRLLGDAARLAAMPPGPDLARELDPRAISARHAGLGSAAIRGASPTRGSEPSSGEPSSRQPSTGEPSPRDRH